MLIKNETKFKRDLPVYMFRSNPVQLNTNYTGQEDLARELSNSVIQKLRFKVLGF